MSTYLPPDLLGAVGDALRAKSDRRSRLRVVAEGRTYLVQRMDGSGFWIAAEGAPSLRGLVDLYDGSVHLARALVVASEEEPGGVRYEYKRATAPMEAPAIDFERLTDGPAGYLPAE